VTPPATVGYWFTPPDAFRTDDVSWTSISLNYSFFVDIGGAAVELYIQPEIQNVFNRQAATSINGGVLTGVDDPSLEIFNPYEETPIEGVHWRKGPNFGQPVAENDYQQPRTFRVSLGVRF
jgi:hypothetical protein